MNYKIKTIENNLGKKILIIPEQIEKEKTYNKTILEEENLNYLPSRMKINYENNAYEYAVKGQTLEEYVKEGNRITKKDIINLLDSIDEMLSEIKNYLLSENNVILDLKTICKDEDKYYFTLAPNIDLDFKYELSKLIIRILRYVNVNDKKTLELAYSLFIKTSQDNYTIDDLLNIINENTIEKYNLLGR